MAEFLNPEQVLNCLDLNKDMVAAEFGCGSGGFALPLAKRLEEGLVCAIDIQEAPLSVLKSRLLSERITNLKIIRSNLEKPRGSTLSDSSLDLVFIVNTLFQIEKKKEIILEAKRILKKGGRLTIADWLPEATQGPAEGRISPELIKKTAEEIGLKLEKDFRLGQYHYGLVFSKP